MTLATCDLPVFENVGVVNRLEPLHGCYSGIRSEEISPDSKIVTFVEPYVYEQLVCSIIMQGHRLKPCFHGASRVVVSMSPPFAEPRGDQRSIFFCAVKPRMRGMSQESEKQQQQDEH